MAFTVSSLSHFLNYLYRVGHEEVQYWSISAFPMVLMNSSYEPNDLDKSVTILNVTDNLEVEKEVPLFSSVVTQWGG